MKARQILLCRVEEIATSAWVCHTLGRANSVPIIANLSDKIEKTRRLEEVASTGSDESGDDHCGRIIEYFNIPVARLLERQDEVSIFCKVLMTSQDQDS